MWIVGIVGAGILALTLFVLGLLKMIAVISGWSLIARHYRATSAPAGVLHPSETLYGRGRSRYIKAVDMYVADKGLYLVMRSMLIALVQPPLFLPWADLHEHDHGAHAVRIGIGTPEIIQIRIPREIWGLRPARAA